MKWPRIAHDSTFSKRKWEHIPRTLAYSWYYSPEASYQITSPNISEDHTVYGYLFPSNSPGIYKISKGGRCSSSIFKCPFTDDWHLGLFYPEGPEPIQLSLRVQMVSINDKLTDEPTCLDAAFWCCLKRWSNMAPYSSWIRCISFMCSAT